TTVQSYRLSRSPRLRSPVALVELASPQPSQSPRQPLQTTTSQTVVTVLEHVSYGLDRLCGIMHRRGRCVVFPAGTGCVVGDCRTVAARLPGAAARRRSGGAR